MELFTLLVIVVIAVGVFIVAVLLNAMFDAWKKNIKFISKMLYRIEENVYFIKNGEKR